jgi:Phosphotransferase enzyme family
MAHNFAFIRLVSYSLNIAILTVKLRCYSLLGLTIIPCQQQNEPRPSRSQQGKDVLSLTTTNSTNRSDQTTPVVTPSFSTATRCRRRRLMMIAPLGPVDPNEDDPMPRWLNDQTIATDWLGSKLKSAGILSSNTDRITSCIVTDMSNAGRRGACPKEGTTLLIKTTTATSKEGKRHEFVMKQVPAANPQLSQQLGLAREGLFYQKLAAKELEPILPRIIYAYGDMESGLKCILMEALADHLDSGILFGPGNPNNWTRDLPQLLQSHYGTSSKPPPSAALVAKQTFLAAAAIHGFYWKDETMLQHEFLRGNSWLQGRGNDAWEASQSLVRSCWNKYREQEAIVDSAASHFQWDTRLRATVEKAISGISWDKQLHRLHVNGRWTLVHGDFWPGNVLVRDNSDSNIRLIDWEMVGLGSGPQDLGQYVLSNMEREERRQCETDLIESYCTALHAHRPVRRTEPDYDALLQHCWDEYKVGGVERFLWFLIYFLGQGNYSWSQYFHNQIADFMHAHQLTPDDITQPRP